MLNTYPAALTVSLSLLENTCIAIGIDPKSTVSPSGGYCGTNRHLADICDDI